MQAAARKLESLQKYVTFLSQCSGLSLPFRSRYVRYFTRKACVVHLEPWSYPGQKLAKGVAHITIKRDQNITSELIVLFNSIPVA